MQNESRPGGSAISARCAFVADKAEVARRLQRARFADATKARVI